MNEPQLSVLIPVWNGAREIHLLLDALAAQTLDSEHFEVVVVDNGSTDCTAEIVGRYAFVRLLSEHRPGSYSARNTGLKVLRGTYVTFTDADCVSLSRTAERANIDIVTAGSQIGACLAAYGNVVGASIV